MGFPTHQSASFHQSRRHRHTNTRHARPIFVFPMYLPLLQRQFLPPAQPNNPAPRRINLAPSLINPQYVQKYVGPLLFGAVFACFLSNWLVGAIAENGSDGAPDPNRTGGLPLRRGQYVTMGIVISMSEIMSRFV